MKRQIFDFFRSIWKIKALEKVLVKLTQGKFYGSPVTKLSPNHYQYPKGTIREVERGGIKYYLDLSDIVDWFIYFGFKEKARDTLLGLIKEGYVIIDVGANVGDITLNSAKIIGDLGEVHSFEPDNLNFGRLSRNINLNSFPNIKINNKGLGDIKGDFLITCVNDRNFGMNRITSSDKTTSNAKSVSIITLDEYTVNKKIDLIKIDVEGFEYNVLKGAQHIINKDRPILFIELDDQNLKEQQSSGKELITFLENKEYKIYNAETNEKITKEYDFTNCHFDIVAYYK